MKVFGSKRVKVTGYWNKGELHDWCTLPSVTTRIKARKVRWAAHMECMGEKRNSNVILMEKPERKRFVVRLGIRCHDIIEMG
jgi:hypothetical protein